MNCRDFLERVEEIAAGDLVLDDGGRVHLEGCTACAGALATARLIEEALAARPAPTPPPKFTSAVLQRIRVERWRAEQRVDALFNVAMVAAALVILIGAGFLFNVTATLELAGSASQLLTVASEEALRRAAPSLGTYVAATALFASALGMWWWAERVNS